MVRTASRLPTALAAARFSGDEIQGGVQVDDLTRLIEKTAREIAEERGSELPADFGPDTRLFGSRGVFDSMGLVSMIVAIEESISDEFGVEVTLADERAMSQKRSPFLTITSLSSYAQKLIDEGR